MKNIRNQLERMNSFLLDKKVVGTHTGQVRFLRKYNIEIPITAIETFSKFGTELQNNKFLFNDVVRKKMLFLLLPYLCKSKFFI